MNKFLKTLALTSIYLVSTTAHAATIAGMNFDDNSLANQVTGSNGLFLNWNPANDATGISDEQLALDMTDTNPGSYVFSYDAGAYIDMSFTNANVYNGAGNDLAMFFVGSGSHTGNLASNDIGGSMTFSDLTYTGYNFIELWDVNGDGSTNDLDLSPIYVAYFDLDILGVDGQTALNNFRINIGDASAIPSLLVALNTDSVTPVPLPAAAWLFITGLGALGLISRRRK
jgi:hypothetical protein